MKLLIHAGIHRTGTTSVQSFLENNRDVLARQGITYPGTGKNHQPLAWGLKRGDQDASDVLALLEESLPAEMAVLSGEDFCIHTDLDWLAKVAEQHDTTAVFYLRRQDHWLMSWYNQHVKWPWHRQKSRMDPAAFLTSIDDYYWLDYATMLERWTDILGADRMRVRVVEQQQVTDVTRDFAGLLGPDLSMLSFESERINDSLSVQALEIARHLGIFELGPVKRQKLLAALRNGLADKKTGINTVYTPIERNKILDRFEDSNAEVARQFFGREALFLQPRPALDDPYFHFPDIGREELLGEWIAPVIHELLKHKKPKQK